MLRKALMWMLSDVNYNIVLYNYRRLKLGMMPRLPSLAKPVTFNEKIMYLKLNSRLPEASSIADKHAVRNFVSERIGDEILIPSYGAFSDPSELDIKNFPDFFVVKPNHASGKILFCKKSEVNVENLKAIAKKWLAIDYSKEGGEYQYKGIERKVVVEEDLTGGGVIDLFDVKFYCFSGVPKLIQVNKKIGGKVFSKYFDVGWNEQSFSKGFQKFPGLIPQPVRLSEMLEIAEHLSKGFDFIRVDLYDVHGKIYFSELTFHPGGGVSPFNPDKYDKHYGGLLELSQLSHDKFPEGYKP